MTIKSPSLAQFLSQTARDHGPDLIYTTLSKEREIDSSTFAQLDRSAREIATHLVQRFPERSRIILLFGQGIDFIRAFFGCLYANMIPVPTPDPSKSADALLKLASIIESSGAVAVLASPAIRAMAEKAELRTGTTLPWFTLADTQGEIVDGLDARIASIRPDDVCFLQYTSGSTRSARGVVVSNSNILSNLAYISDAFRLSPEDVSVTWLPMFHDMGLIGAILGALYSRARSYIYSPLDFVRNPLLWLRAISKYRATVAGSPNFGYDLCVRRCAEEDKEALDLSSWRVAFVGAEPVRAATLKSFADGFRGSKFSPKAFYPCYGLAESTLMVTGGDGATPPTVLLVETESLRTTSVVPAAQEDAATVELVSCGHTHGQVELVLVDPNSAPRRALRADDAVGEIWVRGESVAQGYWENDVETRRVFHCEVDGDPRPFMNTGDLGFTHDGELYVTGRAKDLIIIAGRNYYPQDIEYTAERADPACRPSCCAAFGFTAESDATESLAIVQEIKMANPTPESLQKLARTIGQQVTGTYGVPVHTVVLTRSGSVPKTSSGKVQRARCRDAFLKGELDAIYRWDPSSRPAAGVERPYVAPRNAVEATLAQIWAEALGLERVSVTDDFFLVGGDSLRAAHIASATARAFGVRFEVTHFVQSPTIAEVAKLVEQLVTAEVAAMDDSEAECFLKDGV